jgi:hypothetical protein
VHVIEEHPQMLPLMDEVLRVVRWPDVITPDPKAGRWRYWRSTVGPSRWLFVVVMWDTDEPNVVTAYPKRKDPV